MNQAYTGCNHVRGPGFHMSVGNPSFLLRDGKQEWRTEWHYYFGPSVVLKNGDYAKNQPKERSRFWLVAQWWHDQGGEVVDGVGIWKEPPIITKRYTKRRDGLHDDAAGEVVLRFYEGYEHWLPVKGGKR